MTKEHGTDFARSEHSSGAVSSEECVRRSQSHHLSGVAASMLKEPEPAAVLQTAATAATAAASPHHDVVDTPLMVRELSTRADATPMSDARAAAAVASANDSNSSNNSNLSFMEVMSVGSPVRPASQRNSARRTSRVSVLAAMHASASPTARRHSNARCQHVDPNAPEEVTATTPSFANAHNSNLFICNLNMQVDQADLERVFDKYGTILSSAVMRNIHTGESLGTAFVRMASHKEARQAMEALNGTQLVDRAISVQWARKQHNDAPVGEARKKIMKLFVRNIPLNVTAEILEGVFAPFGQVQQVTLHKDTAPVEDAAMERLIAFVVYAEEGAAERASAAVHNTKPFPSCFGIPIMIKLAEDQVRHNRSRASQGPLSSSQRHRSSRARSGSIMNASLSQGSSQRSNSNNASGAYGDNVMAGMPLGDFLVSNIPVSSTPVPYYTQTHAAPPASNSNSGYQTTPPHPRQVSYHQEVRRASCVSAGMPVMPQLPLPLEGSNTIVVPMLSAADNLRSPVTTPFALGQNMPMIGRRESTFGNAAMMEYPQQQQQQPYVQPYVQPRAMKSVNNSFYQSNNTSGVSCVTPAMTSISAPAPHHSGAAATAAHGPLECYTADGTRTNGSIPNPSFVKAAVHAQDDSSSLLSNAGLPLSHTGPCSASASRGMSDAQTGQMSVEVVPISGSPTTPQSPAKYRHNPYSMSASVSTC